MNEYTVQYRDSEGCYRSYHVLADSIADARDQAHAWADQQTYPVTVMQVYA